jgi:hypothetical protein
VWQWVERGLWQGQRLLLVGYLGLALSQYRPGGSPPWGLGLGCVVGVMPVAGDAQEAAGCRSSARRMAATRRP